MTLREDDLRQRALRLHDLPPLLDGEEDPNGLPHELLGPVEVPFPPDGHALELPRAGRIGRRPGLVEQVVRRVEGLRSLCEASPAKQDRPADARRPRAGRETAARVCERGAGGEELLRLRDVEPRMRGRGQIRQCEALQVGSVGGSGELERLTRVQLDARDVSLPPADRAQQREHLVPCVAGSLGEQLVRLQAESAGGRHVRVPVEDDLGELGEGQPLAGALPGLPGQLRTSSISTDAAGSSHSRHAARAAWNLRCRLGSSSIERSSSRRAVRLASRARARQPARSSASAASARRSAGTWPSSSASSAAARSRW